MKGKGFSAILVHKPWDLRPSLPAPVAQQTWPKPLRGHSRAHNAQWGCVQSSEHWVEHTDPSGAYSVRSVLHSTSRMHDVWAMGYVDDAYSTVHQCYCQGKAQGVVICGAGPQPPDPFPFVCFGDILSHGHVNNAFTPEKKIEPLLPQPRPLSALCSRCEGVQSCTDPPLPPTPSLGGGHWKHSAPSKNRPVSFPPNIPGDSPLAATGGVQARPLLVRRPQLRRCGPDR